MKTVLCYGDSNTWGYTPVTGARYARDVRWTGVTQAALGPEYDVLNEGLNARTTVYDDPWSEGKNGKTYLDVCLTTHKPLDLVVLMLGTNDLKFTDAAGAAKGAETLVKLIRLLSHKEDSSPVFAAGPEILLVAPIRLGEGVSEGQTTLRHGYRQSLLLGELYAEVARVQGTHFLDAARHAEPSARDCIHMEPEWHHALGLAIADAVRSILG
ncbi:MAG: SGNH/GDSL hydrolase family protein [Clostridiales bacterium]|nr:SGNH/GDSL hydrolase family protein [Clostridiales bacterium]